MKKFSNWFKLMKVSYLKLKFNVRILFKNINCNGIISTRKSNILITLSEKMNLQKKKLFLEKMIEY